VPRLRSTSWSYEPDVHTTIELLLGPHELPVEQLAVAWEIARERLMRQRFEKPALPCRRPWAWWQFDAREAVPDFDGETLRLAELGALRDEEFAALREAANEARPRIGTTSERISGGNRETGVSLDVRAVELWDAVREACGE
jgi:hypothetical protein